MNKRLFTSALIIIVILAIIAVLFAPKTEIDSFVYGNLPAEISSGLEYNYSQYYSSVPFLNLSGTIPEGFYTVLLIISLAIVLVIVMLIVSLFIGRKKKNSQGDLLIEQRRRVLDELKAAEKSFLQHRIDKPTFDSISKEKNQELIRVESEIDAQKHMELNKEELKSAQRLSSDKKKMLLDLLAQKQKKVGELKIAEKSYLKRKIDAPAFQKISGDIKKEIISLEGRIKAVQDSEEIEKLKAQLKESASEIAKQKKFSEERKKQDYFQELEEDVIEQSEEI